MTIRFGLGRPCICGHRAASHDHREDWCSAAVERGDPWASDRLVGWTYADEQARTGRVELVECRCERFTRRHRDRPSTPALAVDSPLGGQRSGGVLTAAPAP